jgi:L-amino acid N-acyltransferase YncA
MIIKHKNTDMMYTDITIRPATADDAEALVDIYAYTKLEDILRLQNILNLNACIACPAKEDEYLNKDSIRFHERMGFTRVGEFHNCGYKFNRWYNMVWMEKSIGEHVANQKKIIPFSDLQLV